MTALRILVVADSPQDVQLLVGRMEAGGYRPQTTRVDSPEALCAALAQTPWDLVLCEFEPTRLSAYEALGILRASALDLPFIVFSGSAGEEAAVAAMKAGAHDYLLKSNLARLVPAIERELADFVVRRERGRAEARAAYLANYDELTGLPNRGLFYGRLQQAIEEARRHGRHVAALSLNLNRFRIINETLGFEIGDGILKAVADRLKSALRRGDTVARLAGNEFNIVLADMARAGDADSVAAKILENFAQPFEAGGGEWYVTAAIGIAACPPGGSAIDGLLRQAHAAMREARRQGTNNAKRYAAEMDAQSLETLTLENDLRTALPKQELCLHYQPVIDVAHGGTVGMEALLRWHHPRIGLVPPLRFVPIAEETGLIGPIGEWVLRTACRQTRHWIDAGHPNLRIAVNVSARQFEQPELVSTVAQVLHDSGLDAGHLVLEITEGVVVQHTVPAANALRELHVMGVRISIDDFGTGYSGLSYLRRFPLHAIKIDRSFVRDLSRDPDNAAIVRAIIALAHSLGLNVVAEGVETSEQLAFLRRHACNEVQGYYYSRPVPAEEATAFLAARRAAIGNDGR